MSRNCHAVALNLLMAELRESTLAYARHMQCGSQVGVRIGSRAIARLTMPLRVGVVAIWASRLARASADVAARS